MPGEAVNRGGVHVLRGQLGGVSAGVFWSTQQYWPMSGDECGRALVFGDFDADGIDDLAVGMPGQNVMVSMASGWAPVSDAGSVRVTHGASEDGYIFVPFNPVNLHQNNGATPNLVSDPVEWGDRFGYALAAGDLDGDGFDDLVVGIPFEDTVASGRGYLDAGAVEVLWRR